MKIDRKTFRYIRARIEEHHPCDGMSKCCRDHLSSILDIIEEADDVRLVRSIKSARQAYRKSGGIAVKP